MSPDLYKTLLKKAVGYSVKETVTEYVVEEDGTRRAVREKTQKKYVPPDIAALKTYLELIESKQRGELSAMSDEALEAERLRLLKELEAISHSS